MLVASSRLFFSGTGRDASLVDIWGFSSYFWSYGCLAAISAAFDSSVMAVYCCLPDQMTTGYASI
ncbi:hypothetical protein L208DRAFT_742961 [Tricholoma matsutake]|nr:hypothetical protein L208DRAFT_742961 [Tricholoma matsutake 945]